MPDVGLLIIDGIRDLMYDINSPSESTDLINLLMRWSSGYDLHIHTVLHLNKGDDNTRGHIGTELTEQQHREALENGFGKQVVQGYSNVIAALKQGYASIGYERGRNSLCRLTSSL